MLQFNNVSFRYPDAVALDDVSFTLKKGRVYALIGKNGAGKTTLLRCAAGLQDIDTGTIHINNIDLHTNPQHAQRSIGYARDLFGLYETMTGAEFLRYIAESRKVDADAYKQQYAFINRYLHLDAFASRPISGLTRGMRQKLAIAQTIIHNPALLLLDEPASGLDPDARQQLSLLMIALKEQGKCILVTSHILGELDEYATDVLVLDHAHVENTTAIESALTVTIGFLDTIELDTLQSTLPQWNFTMTQKGVLTECTDKKDAATLIKALVEAAYDVVSFDVQATSLAAIFTASRTSETAETPS